MLIRLLVWSCVCGTFAGKFCFSACFSRGIRDDIEEEDDQVSFLRNLSIYYKTVINENKHFSNILGLKLKPFKKAAHLFCLPRGFFVTVFS